MVNNVALYFKGIFIIILQLTGHRDISEYYKLMSVYEVNIVFVITN